jgi:uncharacterized membrane protein
MEKLLLSIFLMLILDISWLSFFMGPRYTKMIPKIQGSTMVLKYKFAILAYILMIIGINIFVIPNINNNNILLDSLKFGFIYGIILFGVYDFTVASVLKNWDIKIALIDILWGGILFFITSFLTIKLSNYIKNIKI